MGKTSIDKEQQEEQIHEMVESLKADLPKYKPVTPNKSVYNAEIMPIIPMGDPHFGLYCWAEEVGNDFDLDIAKKDLCNAVQYLVNQAAPLNDV